MRIIYLHQYFNTPTMSGGTRSYEMARRWVAAGHEVHLVTSLRTQGRQTGWTTSCEGGATIHWRHIPYSNAMNFMQRTRSFFEFALTASLKARQLKGDVIFATSTPLTVIIPALYATAARQVPIVFEVRDLWPQMPIAAGYLRSPPLRFLATAMEHLAYRSAKRVVALSEAMAEGVIASGVAASKVVVAPNSCDVESFDIDMLEGEKYRAANPWLSDRPFVVYCGTIGKLNGVSYLARLASHVANLDRTIAFGIFGAGSEEREVRAVARSEGVLNVNFFMLGEIPKEEVPTVLSAASVVASVFLPIPEMQANSANKFFDGLAAGRPLAINHGGWQAELLRSTGAGIELDSRDISHAAVQLTEFMSDPGSVATARYQAQRLAYERFSRDAIASLVLSVIEDAAQ